MGRADPLAQQRRRAGDPLDLCEVEDEREGAERSRGTDVCPTEDGPRDDEVEGSEVSAGRGERTDPEPCRSVLEELFNRVNYLWDRMAVTPGSPNN